MANTAALRSSTEWCQASALCKKQGVEVYLPLNANSLNSLFKKGLSRGRVVEMFGPRSTGKTSVCLHLLASATQNQEICALIDTTGSFDPESAVGAGVNLSSLIWIRCQTNPDYAMRAADLLLHAGGFGVIWLDLCDVAPRLLNRIPISYWYRFCKALENTATILLISSRTPQANSSLVNSLEFPSLSFTSHASRLKLWKHPKSTVRMESRFSLLESQLLHMEF